jgi:hypothetical protein
VLDQSVEDFELIVVGDGAPRATEVVMADWCTRDSRIQFQANKKGAGHGELHRHGALQQACGDLVAYLGDDDIWLPHHLQTMAGLLREYDIAHTAQVNVSPQGFAHVAPGRLDTPYGRALLLTLGLHSCGPTAVAHTLAAYRKLPFGWRPKPAQVNCDTYMWQQWVAQPWVNIGYQLRASSLHIGSPRRVAMSDEQRGDESGLWYARSREEDFEQRLMTGTLANWQGQTFHNKHERQILNALICGEPIAAQSIAVLAMQFAQRSDSPVQFTLRQALLAQQSAQWDVADCLYALVVDQVATAPDRLLQAKFEVQAGNFDGAERTLSEIDSNDPDIAEQIQRLRNRCLKRRSASENAHKKGTP